MSCEQCTQGYVVAGEPTGTMVDGAYFRAGPEGSDASKAVVIVTDIYGLPLKNCKIIADELSKRVGCDVWVPDLFAGNPPLSVEQLGPLTPDRPGQKMGLGAKLRFFLILLTHGYKLFGIRASVVDPRAAEFVTKIKKEKGYQKVGAAGYCFGGSMTVRLGSTDLFSSVVILHPGAVTAEQMKAIKTPASWACAEDDMTFTKSLRDQAEAIFAARKDKPDYIDYEFKDYKGTCHGFAARPNLAIPEIVEAYNGALEQVAVWFQKTLQ
ncbi:uncharacterized protein PHACADRAFT_265215 [Phanerochaete carnosa HHB-10118-sp]|uniref:Dienelactone hydrolase domain-containing protein n=1 Tax=Phanerochaete carnosa (strain HHB-10118-sp) TaxID=650164 RepID=K5VEP9_PHACS|nr:uncharacterized protein PHACADRAFT_265215 [Phanerochaete carnosa HHB-10118-sp]EKM49648.1 hypothetical protein PHACADRAFT_265215 [Phanerochaete carnosa HHB-10118-sp]